MEKNLFDKAADAQGKVSQAGKGFLKNSFIYLLLIVLITLTVFFSLASPELVNRWTRAVIVNAIYIFIVSSVSLISFFWQGESNEKATNEAYKSNTDLWGEKSDTVRKDGKIGKLKTHCKTETENLRESKKEFYIHSAGIDLCEYEKNYQSKTIRQIRKDKDLNQSQKRFLIKAKKHIKIKPINYMLILAGADIGQGQSVGQKRRIDTRTKILSKKYLTITLNTILLASIGLAPTSGSVWEIVGLCALRVFAIIMSSLSGYYGGITKVRTDNTDNKARIAFLDEFLETENKN